MTMFPSKQYLFLILSSVAAKLVAGNCTSVDGKYYYEADIEIQSMISTISCSTTEQATIGAFLDAAFDTVATAGAYIGPLDMQAKVCTQPVPKVAKCCSWDYKNCGSDVWCNSENNNCEGACGGAYINPLETTQCKSLWNSCSTSSECCGKAECFVHEDGWKGCEPLGSGLKVGIKEVGCCSTDLKYCTKNTWCDFRALNCAKCNGFFIKETTATTTCKARYTTCGSSSECCPGTVCGTLRGFKHCNIPSTFPIRRGLGSGSNSAKEFLLESLEEEGALTIPEHKSSIPEEFNAIDLDYEHQRSLLTVAPTSGWVYRAYGGCRLCNPDNKDRRQLEFDREDFLEESVASIGTSRMLLRNSFTSVENDLKQSLDPFLTKGLQDKYGNDPTSCLYQKNVQVNVQISQGEIGRAHV